jgi:hypothetical protein
MRISPPVRGLRPVRAARVPTVNVPKPISVTDPLSFNVVVTADRTASSARVAVTLGISAEAAIWSISSVLFMGVPPSGYTLEGRSFSHKKPVIEEADNLQAAI